MSKISPVLTKLSILPNYNMVVPVSQLPSRNALPVPPSGSPLSHSTSSGFASPFLSP